MAICTHINIQMSMTFPLESLKGIKMSMINKYEIISLIDLLINRQI